MEKIKFFNMPFWKKRDGGERSDHEDDDCRNGCEEPPIIKKTAKETCMTLVDNFERLHQSNCRTISELAVLHRGAASHSPRFGLFSVLSCCYQWSCTGAEHFKTAAQQNIANERPPHGDMFLP